MPPYCDARIKNIWTLAFGCLVQLVLLVEFPLIAVNNSSLKPASRHRRGRVSALRGRHTANTHQSSHRHIPRASHGTAGR
eukprot:6395412-Prymnesium_polylepis.1